MLIGPTQVSGTIAHQPHPHAFLRIQVLDQFIPVTYPLSGLPDNYRPSCSLRGRTINLSMNSSTQFFVMRGRMKKGNGMKNHNGT